MDRGDKAGKNSQNDSKGKDMIRLAYPVKEDMRLFQCQRPLTITASNRSVPTHKKIHILRS